MAWVALVGLAALAPGAAAQEQADRRQQQRLDEAARRESEALVELVDRTAAGRTVPSDFVMSWRHDFLKAQPGTFVPFVLTFERPAPGPAQALMYVRVVRQWEPARAEAASQGRTGRERYAFDAVFPVELPRVAGNVRVVRGFAVPAGDYDVFVAVRERPENPLTPAVGEPLRTGVLRQSLRVPDFWSGEFATSTVMLAHRIEALARPLGPDEALDRPYVIGLHDVHVAFDGTFRRDRELIVVFVIYNPTVVGGEFDVRVDYHVFSRTTSGTPPPGDPRPQPGDRYVTRTDAQRFNSRTLREAADPAAGHPVMAGQGILLRSFEPGEYRIGITVTDLLSDQRLTRDVLFRVIDAEPDSGGPGR